MFRETLGLLETPQEVYWFAVIQNFQHVGHDAGLSHPFGRVGDHVEVSLDPPSLIGLVHDREAQDIEVTWILDLDQESHGASGQLDHARGYRILHRDVSPSDRVPQVIFFHETHIVPTAHEPAWDVLFMPPDRETGRERQAGKNQKA